jgi:hypothetical protein
MLYAYSKRSLQKKAEEDKQFIVVPVKAGRYLLERERENSPIA